MKQKTLSIDQLSVGELEAALHRELEAPKPNPEAVCQLLRALYPRVQNAHKPTPGELAAYRDFLSAQECAMEFAPHRTGFSLRPFLIAAVLVCLLLAMALGAMGTGGVFPVWDADIFQLTGQEMYTEPPSGDSCYITENDQLLLIYRVLEDTFGPQNVMPTWIPDGLSLQELEFVKWEQRTSLDAALAEGENFIALSFTLFGKGLHYKYYKDDIQPIIYQTAGIEHYLFSNAGIWCAVWTANGIECSVAGNCSRETLCRIIDSIYEEHE